MSASFDPYSSSPPAGQSEPELPSSVPTHLVKAILSTCVCFAPLGIVAIVFAAQVNVRLQYGDRAGAMKASQQANFYGNLSIWLGILSYLALLATIAILVLIGGSARTG